MHPRMALAALFCASCASVGSSAVELRDPLALVDDVYNSGNQLRLYVVPSDRYACDPLTGAVTPAVPDVAPGMFPDAVTDVALGRGDTQNHSINVPPGSWTVYVRGKGNDAASGQMNVPIAQGCAQAMVGSGESQAVNITLAAITVRGVCGDGLLSADEQCEPPTPSCGADCRTQVETLNTTTALGQTRPRVASRAGQRSAVIWDTQAGGSTTVGLRYFDASGYPLMGVATLGLDTTIDAPPLMALAGVQQSAAVAVAGTGTVAIALTDFGASSAAPPNVTLVFADQNRQPVGAPAGARTASTGMQTVPAVAYHGGGALMVVFADDQSATGLSGRVFAAGATTPSGGEAFEVGAGTTGGAAPSIAGTSSGFVVAFAAGGDIHHQRFDTGGMPLDAMAVRTDTAGSGRDTPSVGALADGSFLVAWAEANAAGDGMGSGVRARAFGADGTAVRASFLVNTTLAGDQTAPAVAGAATRFLVAFQTGAGIAARSFDGRGDAVLNHEPTPSLAEFPVAGTGAHPAAAAVGGGATGAWWVVWDAPGDGQDVFGRHFPQ